MALRGCLACMRYMVIITNLLLWLAGIGVLAVSIYLHLTSKQYLTFSADNYMYHTAVIILIGAGAVMTIVGFVGCCGALRESQCMLGIYFVLLLVIFAAELTGGVWAFLHKDELKSTVTKYVNNMVGEQYYVDGVAKNTIDAMQHDLKCCGANGPYDWASANNERGEKKSLLDMTLGRVSGVFEVPPSCCNVDDKNLCETIRKFAGGSAIVKGIHSTGCVDRLKEYLEQNLLIVIGVAIGVAITQLIALVFSIVLCCGIRDTDVMYKA